MRFYDGLTDTRNQLNREACHRKSTRRKKLSWTRLNSACYGEKQCCLIIIEHLVPNFIKCWCLLMTKYIQNSKNRAKNKILLKKNNTKRAIFGSRPWLIIFIVPAGEKIQSLAGAWAPVVPKRVDILCAQLHYICFTAVLDVVRWVVAGCYNGLRYKKSWKPLIEYIRH